MASPQLNVGVASNDRRMFEIVVLNCKQLSEALTRAIEDY